MIIASSPRQFKREYLHHFLHAAKRAGYRRGCVRSLIESGELPVVRFGPKTRRFDPADVLALAERLKTKDRSKQSGGAS
jgi:excisionase family DNA binding protein